MNWKFETIVKIFLEHNTAKYSHHFEKHERLLSKYFLKKWPQNGP